MTPITFNCPDRMGDLPRNWRVYDFTLVERLPPRIWEYLREILPTNPSWQFPGMEAFVL